MKNKNEGIVLISAMLTLVLLSALAAFFIGVMISEFRISTSNRSGIVSFYAAESGIQEALFTVKNNESLRTNFEDGNLSYSLSRNPFLAENTSYSVTIESLTPGEAEIVSTGKYESGFFDAQRVVKTKIVAGTNPEPDWTNVLYGSRDISIFASAPNIIGDLYAARDIDVWGFSNVDVTGNIYANEDINIWLFSDLNATGEMRADNYPPPPDVEIEMPIIDFDSESPNSLYNMADQIYTQNEFRDLIKDEDALTLNGITYVTGNVNIKQTDLTVNGVLVADGNIDIGMTFPGIGKPNPSINVNQQAPGELSGLLSKSKIQLGVHARDMFIDGLIYSMDEFKIFNFANNMIINGGAIAGEISIMNIVSSNFEINYNPDLIRPLLQLENSESPPVEIEHWEESY